MYVLGAIFARGGSKGIPRKNLRFLGGKPLIAWAIEAARGCPSLDRLIVSTDDAEIAEVARQCGAETPFMRPEELSRDDSPEWLAWQHALQTLEEQTSRRIDVMVSVPPTSPLRRSEDVERCLAQLVQRGADAVITVREAGRSPYFNMVKMDNGFVAPVLRPEKPIYRRQEAPPVYEITTVAVAARRDYVMQSNYLFHGKVQAIVVPPESAIDIDTELDFQFAEFLLARRSMEAQR